MSNAKPAVVNASARFENSLEKLGPTLTSGVYREVADFLRRDASSRAKVAGLYDRLENCRPEVVLEFELGASDRALAHWSSPVLTLLDVGDHEVVNRYQRQFLARDLKSSHPFAGWNDKPRRLLRFFGDNPDTRQSVFGTELEREWIYYLADPQSNVATAISKAYKQSTRDKPSVILIVGGPGTGKTSILVKAMLDLRTKGASPGLIVSDGVAEQISVGCGLNIQHWRAASDGKDFRRKRFDVLLYDDPPTLDDLVKGVLAGFGVAKVLVLAFDPCQLAEDFDDAAYDDIVSGTEAKVYELKACYRQKESLGRASKRVMDRVAESTPFLAEEKVAGFQRQHELIYRIANDMYFPNPHGYEKTYVHATADDARRETGRLRSAPLWRHQPPLLLVVDKSVDVNWPWTNIMKGIGHTRVDFDPSNRWSALGSVKGIEFQHAFLVLGESLFEHLEEGFRGSGQNLYHARRMLRIPFTRAKDSLVTFVVSGGK